MGATDNSIVESTVGKEAYQKLSGTSASFGDNLWIVDGKLYDFTEWAPKHPGGASFFAISKNRDISAAVYAYHKNPAATVVPLLKKYEVKMEKSEDVRAKLATGMGVPPFILPPGFDAKEHMPTYDWSKPFLLSLQKRLNTTEMREKIRKADERFDLCGVGILIAHIMLSFPVLYYQLIPAWLLVLSLVTTRTSLAAIGHYHCHRAVDGVKDWGECLFDMQYVAPSIVLYDGHVLIHHLYTETPADVKRTVFCGMLMLPRILRVPIFTIQKFGQFLTGMLIRWAAIQMFYPPLRWKGSTQTLMKKHGQFLAVRFLLIAEFIFACKTGHAALWFTQFFFAVWINMFMIVSSHDFEEVREVTGYNGLDWGAFQVENALDTYITGIQSIDIFLTAGLGCHRAHHVLPYQKSGFANIASQDALMETCKEFNVPWAPKRNLVRQRLIPLAVKYLTMPAQMPALPEPILYGGRGVLGFAKEHFAPGCLWNCAEFVVTGFTGEGSI